MNMGKIKKYIWRVLILALNRPEFPGAKLPFDIRILSSIRGIVISRNLPVWRMGISLRHAIILNPDDILSDRGIGYLLRWTSILPNGRVVRMY